MLEQIRQEQQIQAAGWSSASLTHIALMCTSLPIILTIKRHISRVGVAIYAYPPHGRDRIPVTLTRHIHPPTPHPNPHPTPPTPHPPHGPQTVLTYTFAPCSSRNSSCVWSIHLGADMSCHCRCITVSVPCLYRVFQ